MELMVLRLLSFYRQDQMSKHFHCQYHVAKKRREALFGI